ncbi:MAG: glycosyltransferase [Acidobacteriota bacterium]|nr:glycosyltransferase [Acidobacteriota bacterium]
MRIAYILTSLGIGGAEKQVLALAERMAARGHAITLLVLREPQVNQWFTRLPVHYLHIRKSPGSVFGGLLRARRVLREFQPDLVHSHTFPANMAARMLRLAGGAPRVVSTIHNVYEGGTLRMALYRITDTLAVHTTAVSTAAAERFVKLRAVPAHKCSVLTNAIDLTEFKPSTERRLFMRGLLHNSEDFIWLAIGRIAPAKDYPNLLRAFSRVLDLEPYARLWICGELPCGLSPEGLFERSSVSSAVRERCIFFGVRNDVADLLDAADGFVLSSAWEGMPLVVGEAMAMEKPIVATDVGGVRELLGNCGSIVLAGDSTALADSMLVTMRLKASSLHDLGKAARERVSICFGWERREHDWEQLYARLLADQVLPEVKQSVHG